jgi:hypothetical protein
VPSSTQGECANSLSGAVWDSVSMAVEESSMNCDDQDDLNNRGADRRCTSQVDMLDQRK